jgi:hypothetical protein
MMLWCASERGPYTSSTFIPGGRLRHEAMLAFVRGSVRVEEVATAGGLSSNSVHQCTTMVL